MRIGKPTGLGQDLRISGFLPAGDNNHLGILRLEMTWDEWDILVKDAEYLRRTGEFRDLGSPRSNTRGATDG